MIGDFVIAETESAGGKTRDARAGLGVGFSFGVGLGDGVKVGFGVSVGDGVKVGFGDGTFTETPLFQINFLPDLIQVYHLP